MQNLMLVIIIFIATIGPAVVIAVVGYASVMSVGRNPSAAPRILLSMITAFIFAEGIAILALLTIPNLLK